MEERASYTGTVNQKNSLQKAVLNLKIKKSLNMLNERTDTHLYEPNREDGFAMATSSQTAMSITQDNIETKTKQGRDHYWEIC